MFAKLLHVTYLPMKWSNQCQGLVETTWRMRDKGHTIRQGQKRELNGIEPFHCQRDVTKEKVEFL